MIATFFGQDGLGSNAALLLSLLLGFGFGVALEQAGFGSSRRLAGIFYFRDMTVLRVMFTAMVTAMLGLQLALALGFVTADQIYFLPTIYGAQIVGGLLFGVGFVLSSWCPGTAAVGLASGRLDALIFLGGAMLGSILFNEFYGLVAPLVSWGDSGVQFAWAALGLSAPIFGLLFAAAAVAAFWGSEWIEKKVAGAGPYLGSPFLKAFSVVILAAALGVALLPPAISDRPAAITAGLLTAIEAGEDHIEPDDLADRLMAGRAGLLLVDIRTPAEFAAFHIRSAVNVAAADLPEFLAPYKNKGTIVLYSNGMTHSAQARDALARLGFTNAYLLTDGLQGFIQVVLKPVSLREMPLPAGHAAKVGAWRKFFLDNVPAPAPARSADLPADAPRLVETGWLQHSLGRDDLRIIALRPQPASNGGHTRYASLSGGWEQWAGEQRPVDTRLPPQRYPIHSSAHSIGVTGESFTEISCLGIPSIVPQFRAAHNEYRNPFGSEIALFRTSEGGMSRMAVCWDIPAAGGEQGRVYGQKNDQAAFSTARPALPPGMSDGTHGGANYFTCAFVDAILRDRNPLVGVV